MIRIIVGNRRSVLTQEGDEWLSVEEAEARLNETVEDVYERVFGERPMSVEARLALLEKKAALADAYMVFQRAYARHRVLGEVVIRDYDGGRHQWTADAIAARETMEAAERSLSTAYHDTQKAER